MRVGRRLQSTDTGAKVFDKRHGATIIHPMNSDNIKRGDTVSNGSQTGTVVAVSEGGVVVRWGGDITLEQAGDLAPAAPPVPAGLTAEQREALHAWQVPE